MSEYSEYKKVYEELRDFSVDKGIYIETARQSDPGFRPTVLTGEGTPDILVVDYLDKVS